MCWPLVVCAGSCWSGRTEDLSSGGFFLILLTPQFQGESLGSVTWANPESGSPTLREGKSGKESFLG